MNKCLLLNSTYEILCFIPERRAIKLLFKQDKVEVLSTWDHYIYKNIKHPAILRLKNHVKRKFFSTAFSRKALIKRDKSTCQFCAIKLPAAHVTIDHVIPKAQGGGTSFLNCVVSCKSCNNKKGGKTPEQAGMTIINKPIHPGFSTTFNLNLEDKFECWHSDWEPYIIK